MMPTVSLFALGDEQFIHHYQELFLHIYTADGMNVRLYSVVYTYQFS